MKGFATTLLRTTFTLVFAVILTSSLTVQAQQYGGYGGYGTPSGNASLMVDKLVGRTPNPNLSTVEYVDNLSTNDIKFKPEDTVAFKLKVKNTSQATLGNIKLQDLVPPYITPVNGVTGWDSGARIVRIEIGELKANEEKDFVIPMKVVPGAELPITQGVICIVNRAQVNADHVADDDTAQFCVEKPPGSTPTPTLTPTPTPTGAPAPTAPPNVSVVPSTGPEQGFLVVAAQLLTLTAGIYLRRKTS